MRLLDRVRAANYLPEDRLSGTWYSQTYTAGPTETIQPTFQSYVERGFGGDGVVFGLILARAKLFSEAVFKFQNTTTKKLFGNGDLAVLENPWPGGTTGELLIRMLQDADLAGNAFIRNDGDRLVRLRPDWVQLVMNVTGDDVGRSRRDVIGYIYWPCGPSEPDNIEMYPIDEVAHWTPIPDPAAEYRGMSWLTPVVREINADIGMTEYKRRFVDNSATPNLLIKYKQQLTKTALRDAGEQWNAKYGGPDGLKTAVLDNGADVTVIGAGLGAMDFSTVQAAGENRIAVAAGVPGIVAGLKEGLDAATYSNYVQAMRAFADLTMRPTWRSACSALQKLVTVPADSRLWYDTTDIAALQEGEKERAETLQILATTASSLITAGYAPDSVTAALISGDMSQLTHTGAIPTTLFPQGQAPTGGTP